MSDVDVPSIVFSLPPTEDAEVAKSLAGWLVAGQLVLLGTTTFKQST
jgi:hypothetical protein